MGKNIVWSLDKSPDEAHPIYEKVLAKMREPIIMCILKNKLISPSLQKEHDISKSWHEQEQGWLFCGQGELKWRRLDSLKLRFVYIGDSDNTLDDIKTMDISHLRETDGQFLAWGSRGEREGFYEERLGQGFDYPIGPAPKDLAAGVKNRPSFWIKKYLDPKNGELQFWRHFQIKWADKGV